MTGPAPVEMLMGSGWFVLLGVILGGALVLSISIWWDNRRDSRPVRQARPVRSELACAPQALTEDAFRGIKVRKAPLTGAVTEPDAGQGRHHRPEVAA